MDLLRNPICPTLLEVVHSLHNFVVFFEFLLEEGVDIADSFDISVLIMLTSCVLNLLVVVQLEFAEDIFRVGIINKGILFGGYQQSTAPDELYIFGKFQIFYLKLSLFFD